MPAFAIVPAALAGAIVMDVYHTRRNKKRDAETRKAVETMIDNYDTVIDLLKIQQNASHDAAVMFASILVDHEVELDEFELIAVNALTQ